MTRRSPRLALQAAGVTGRPAANCICQSTRVTFSKTGRRPLEAGHARSSGRSLKRRHPRGRRSPLKASHPCSGRRTLKGSHTGSGAGTLSRCSHSRLRSGSTAGPSGATTRRSWCRHGTAGRRRRVWIVRASTRLPFKSTRIERRRQTANVACRGARLTLQTARIASRPAAGLTHQPAGVNRWKTNWWWRWRRRRRRNNRGLGWRGRRRPPFSCSLTSFSIDLCGKGGSGLRPPSPPKRVSRHAGKNIACGNITLGSTGSSSTSTSPTGNRCSRSLSATAKTTTEIRSQFYVERIVTIETVGSDQTD